jgi:hypothetical protein|tara:strand:+ start:1099 stop:1449 length:351 start_codon:yes stop_codon:yes gene_type:complete
MIMSEYRPFHRISRPKKDKRRSKRWFKRKYSDSDLARKRMGREGLEFVLDRDIETSRIKSHGCMYSKSQAEREYIARAFCSITKTGLGILPLKHRELFRRNGGGWGHIRLFILRKF